MQNLGCYYLQNTITNGEKIFDSNNIDYPIDIIVALRGEVSQNLRIAMIRNYFINVIRALRGGVSEPISNYEYLHILPQHSGIKAFGWQRFVITDWL